MTGKLLIDDLDAYTRYGIFVEDGGYAGLVEWPALKSVDANDWPDEDGIEADLSDPKLESKSFSMSFCCVDHEKTISLFQKLTAGAYHTFFFKEIGLEKKLRLVSQPNTTTIAPFQVFSLQFADDNYMEEYDRNQAGLATIASCTQRGYEIDDLDLSGYGVWVTAGTLDSIVKAPQVKQNLGVSAGNMGGMIYEDSNVVFQSKDVSLKCVLRAPDLAAFWTNYKALLHDLTRPGIRTFSIARDMEVFECHYNGSAVSKFAKLDDGGVWCEFDISLMFTADRPGDFRDFLATENEELIITEGSTENNNVFIDITEYEN